ncbi:hypothetical protein [Streptomyces achromogenes]|uniref:hypothetical protein n=1 Tax=Streptomyces achromogenes TaxID=67255 RepID=UPI0036F71343
MSTPPDPPEEPRHEPSPGEPRPVVPPSGEPRPVVSVPVSPSGGPDHVSPSGEPRYEPPPGPGRLALWILLFAVAALAVVLGGVYFT